MVRDAFQLLSKSKACVVVFFLWYKAAFLSAGSQVGSGELGVGAWPIGVSPALLRLGARPVCLSPALLVWGSGLLEECHLLCNALLDVQCPRGVVVCGGGCFKRK